MASKGKFQISRSLDDRIKKLIVSSEECDPHFASIDTAFILGFNYMNVTNYVGLSTQFDIHNASTAVTGLVYFKSSPTAQQIHKDLQPVIDFFHSEVQGLGSNTTTDKNESLYLICHLDQDSKTILRKLYDWKLGAYLSEQPKLSTLDDPKIYAHSAITRIRGCFKINLTTDDNKQCGLTQSIDEAKAAFSGNVQGLKLYLDQSNFSTPTPHICKTSLETLYSHLDVPNEVLQAGDYLPQATKEEKKKLIDRWRNKVKDQRSPICFNIEHDILSVDPEEKESEGFLKLHIDEIIYLHVNDTVAKCVKYILLLLRTKLELLKREVIERRLNSISSDHVKPCTFRPPQTNHFVPALYLISTSPDQDEFKRLSECRKELHEAYMIPLEQPAVRYSQRITNVKLENSDQQVGYLCNVHTDLADKSGIKGGVRSVIGGTYTYHHYLQDRIQDSGWGCAYRSLQTIISWFKHQGYIYSPDVAMRSPAPTKSDSADKTSELRSKLHAEARVPTHEEIQSVLVDVGDKQPSFVGSQKWIGSQEVCYVLSHLYNLDSKFISVSSGNELIYKARDLGQHFALQSTPVMIGGGVLAHTIIGIDFNEKNGDIGYLILDPHYTGGEDLATITKKGWCGWKKNAFWDKSAFYNLCLPQRPSEY